MSSVSDNASSSGHRESIKTKNTGGGIQTLKRAKAFTELSAAKRHEAQQAKRRKLVDDTIGDEQMSGGATSSTAGTLEEKKTDEQVQSLLVTFKSYYLSSSNPQTPSYAPNPAIPIAQRAQALQGLRMVLSHEEAPITAVVEAGVVPLLITELQTGGTQGAETSATTQMDALWCLTNIASGTTAQTRAVLPAAPALIALLSSASMKVQEQCVWCLGNLASEEQECRRQLIENGILIPLVRLIQAGVPQPCSPPPHLVPAPTDAAQLRLLRVIAWTISNLIKLTRSIAKVESGAAAGPDEAAKHSAAFSSVANILLPTALALLRSADEQIATEIAWMLAAWSNHSDQVLQELSQAGLIEGLISRLILLQQTPAARGSGIVVDPTTKLERDPLAPALIPLVRMIGNMAHASDSLVLALINHTFTAASSTATAQPEQFPSSFLIIFSTLDRALSSIHRGLKKETCWVIANLAATNLPQVHDALICAQNGRSVFLNHLFTILFKGNFDLQRESCHALYNLSRSSEGKYMHLILPRYQSDQPDGVLTLQVLQRLFEFLKSRDTEAIFIALRLIELVLKVHPDGVKLVEEHNGIDALESVQTSCENVALVAESQKLVDQYFGADAGLDEEEMREDAEAKAPEEEYPPWRLQHQTSPNQPQQTQQHHFNNNPSPQPSGVPFQF